MSFIRPPVQGPPPHGGKQRLRSVTVLRTPDHPHWGKGFPSARLTDQPPHGGKAFIGTVNGPTPYTGDTRPSTRAGRLPGGPPPHGGNASAGFSLVGPPPRRGNNDPDAWRAKLGPPPTRGIAFDEILHVPRPTPNLGETFVLPRRFLTGHPYGGLDRHPLGE